VSRPSFTRELFNGRVETSDVFPYPLLGSGRFQQMQDVFARMRQDASELERGEGLLRGLGLLGSLDWQGARFLPGRARLIQQLATVDASAAASLLVHEALGVSVLRRAASPAALARLAAAPRAPLFAFALTEASPGSDVSQLLTYAEPEADGGFRLRGSKSWVTNAAFATHFVLLARTVPPHAGDKPRLTAFLVERGPGVSVQPLRSAALPRAGLGNLTLDDVAVPADHVLGEFGKGFRVVMDALSEGRLFLGAAVLGVCLHAVNQTIARTRERRAFGRSIGQFPSVRERVSRMLAECLAAESLVYLCLALAERTGELDAVESAVVRLHASRSAARVLNSVQELAGAQAFLADAGPLRQWADGRALCLLDGSDPALESYITLEGTRVARHRAERLAEALAHPLASVDALGELALDNVRRRLERLPLTGDPELVRLGARLSALVADVGRGVQRQLRRYGAEIIEMQHVQRRLAVAVTELSAWVAVLARAERARADHGETGARRMVELATLWCRAADARISRAVRELETNDDELRDRVATRAYTDAGYPFDVF
jgi:acyl-CoA dehydrogenase family protein 9